MTQGVVVVLGVLALGLSATPSADAHTGAPYLVNDARFGSIMVAGGDGFYVDSVRLPESNLYLEGRTAEQAKIGKTLWRARMAATTLPALRTLGTIGLGVAAFDLGWRIGTTLDTHLLHINSPILQASGAGAACASGSAFTYTVNSLTGAGPWWLAEIAVDLTDPFTCTDATVSQNPFACPGLGASPCDEQWRVDLWTEFTGLPGTSVEIPCAVSGACSGSPEVHRHYKKVTETEMEEMMEVEVFEPWTTQSYDTATSGFDATSPELGDGRAKIETDVSHKTETWVNWIIDPTYPEPEEGDTFTIPRPHAHETYAAYVARLRVLGALGTITRLDLEDEVSTDPARAPGEAVSTVPRPTLTVPKTADIVVETNPNVCPSCLGGGGAGDSCNCVVPAVNFAPLTDLPCSASFPCGVFTWLATTLSIFAVSPDAPVLAPHVEAVDLDYSVDLDPFSPYMSMIRTLVAWVLWIGAIWFVGTRLLGFTSSGDVSEAADEAYE